MNTKSFTLIAIFTALTITLSLVFPLLLLFVFIIISMVIRPREAMLLGMVIGFTSYLLGGQILALSNVILLPIIAFALNQLEPYIYGRSLSEGCHSDNAASRWRLGLVVFVLILIANTLNEGLAALLINGGIPYLIASIPIIVLGAIGNALLIGLFGIFLQLRLQKIIQ
jgi:hypothetical protein